MTLGKLVPFVTAFAANQPLCKNNYAEIADLCSLWLMGDPSRLITTKTPGFHVKTVRVFSVFNQFLLRMTDGPTWWVKRTNAQWYLHGIVGCHENHKGKYLSSVRGLRAEVYSLWTQPCRATAMTMRYLGHNHKIVMARVPSLFINEYHSPFWAKIVQSQILVVISQFNGKHKGRFYLAGIIPPS